MVVDLIHTRLKGELERLGLKPAAAARAVGEPDSQGLRDVLGGRKRLSAELLAALAATGVDVAYVLTGERRGLPPLVLTPDEQVLLDGYRALDPATRKRLLAFVLGGDSPSFSPRSQFVIANAAGAQAAGRKIVNKKEKP